MDAPVSSGDGDRWTYFRLPARRLARPWVRWFLLPPLATAIAVAGIALVGIGGLLGFELAERLGWPQMPVAFGMIAVLMGVASLPVLGIHACFESRRAARIRRTRQGAANRSLRDYAEALVGAWPALATAHPERLARTLLDEAVLRGQRGILLHGFRGPDPPTWPEPLAVPFEPMPLSEADGGLIAFAAAPQPSDADARPALSARRPAGTRRLVTDAFERLPAPVLLIGGVLAVLCVAGYGFARPRELPGLLVLAIITVAVTLLAAALNRTSRAVAGRGVDVPPVLDYTGDWFLCPGAVLLRWPQGARYRAATFYPWDANVILLPLRRGRWGLWLGSRSPAEDGAAPFQPRAYRDLSERERCAFLAAWTSPRMPPRPAQIEAWCGGEEAAGDPGDGP